MHSSKSIMVHDASCWAHGRCDTGKKSLTTGHYLTLYIATTDLVHLAVEHDREEKSYSISDRKDWTNGLLFYSM